MTLKGGFESFVYLLGGRKIMTATIIRKPGDWVKPEAGYFLAVVLQTPRKA